MRNLVTLFLICQCLLLAQARAELYQWKDANGTVHFSDKKPTSNYNTLDYDSQFGLPTMSLDPVTVLPYRGSKALQQVLVMPLNYIGFEQNRADQDIGAFYFGPDCVSPTTMQWQQLLTDFPHTVPSERSLQDSIAAALRKLGYNVNRGYLTGGKPGYVRHAAYELDAKLIDLELHTCAATQPRSRKQRRAQRSQLLKNRYFNKTHSRVKIQWLLKAHDSGKVVFTAVSEGATTASENAAMNMQTAFLSAIKDAARRLTANPALLDILQSPEDTPTPTRKRAVTPAAQAEPGFWDKLGSFRQKYSESFRARAKFAEVMAIFSGMKIHLAQYYMENGSWPVSFHDIGVKAVDFTKDGLIDHVKLGRKGEIELDVSSGFGTGAFVLVTPQPNSAMIKWQCKMSMAEQTLKHIGTEACQAY
ncbi:MAG: DUF4124 domain-containing protein [Pseudomonadales bacterium]